MSKSGKNDVSSLLRKAGLGEFTYINTGHSGLGADTIAQIANAGLKIAVLIHDLIPLEYPDHQNPDSVGKFAGKMQAVCEYADLILANSKVTAEKVRTQFSEWGREVRPVVSHLGVEVPDVGYEKHEQKRPYFCAIGTIEPRKNHKLLLDVWDEFEVDGPALHIVGRRGWNNQPVFDRLDRAKDKGLIFEHNDLPDAELWPLLHGSRALLFPSFAEGFGLPSLEAAALGVPVVCGDFAVHRELLGVYPVYADTDNIYLWKQEIENLASSPSGQVSHEKNRQRPNIPSWRAHFDAVNTALATLG
ncbi:MAG: glycosyltransferase family 4 protein [Litoreibacter sp.]|nr:glycosyltransferase family 4 protein [Litoreibacter sp.]